jgi:GntR family transcriptional repressor for pyruvate dehydrogenase complex
MLFRRVQKDRVSDKVVEQILELIEEGKLRVGDQLPGERDLMDQLDVARASVREALRILEFQGIIEVQPGRGAFVTSEVINETGTDDGVRRWFREHSSEMLEILEVREALEARAACKERLRTRY